MKRHQSLYTQRNFEGNMSNIVVMTVPAAAWVLIDTLPAVVTPVLVESFLIGKLVSLLNMGNTKPLSIWDCELMSYFW